MDHIPDEIEDIRYCVLDCTDRENIDFYFLPLIFLESFYSPAVVLDVGPHTIKMPLDWSILVTDETMHDLEIMPLTSINDRGFSAVVFNPLKHMIPEVHEVNITNVFADAKWFFPKLKNGNVLAVPVEDGDEPKCILFVKECAKVSEPIDIASLFQ